MSADASEGLGLADVIAAIKRELKTYEKATNDGQHLGLELTDVDVTLAVKTIKKADGSISVGISFFGIGGKVGGGAEISAEDVSTLSVKLAPPKQDVLMVAGETEDLGLASMLIEARAQLIAGLGEEPVLAPKALTLEVKFAVTKGGGPKAAFEFKIISGSATGTVSRADTQVVKLTFKEPEDL